MNHIKTSHNPSLTIKSPIETDVKMYKIPRKRFSPNVPEMKVGQKVEVDKEPEKQFPFFQLPKVKFPDRYCFRCGQPVKATWKECTRANCGARLIGQPTPVLENGWKFCTECNVGLLRKGQSYCSLCQFETPFGRQFREEKEKIDVDLMERKKALKRRRGEAEEEAEVEDDITLLFKELDYQNKSSSQDEILPGGALNGEIEHGELDQEME